MKNNLRPCNFCAEKKKIRPLYRRFGYQIVRCGRCGLIYLSDLPKNDELNTLYTKAFFKSSSKFAASKSNPSYINALKRVVWILNFSEIKTIAWLDVGCATGDFLLAAKPYVSQLHGNDVSTYATKEGRRRGLKNMRQGDFSSLRYPARAFDVISMWDLIEHVPDPHTTLTKAYKALRPGGYLVLSTGDVDSLLSRVTGRFWHLMIPPLHIYFFSKRTIRQYLEICGFEHITVSYPGKIVPLDFLIEKFFRLINPELSYAIARRLKSLNLGRVKLPINFFDIMTIKAQKPA